MAIEAKIYPVLIPVSTHLEPVADKTWSSFKGVSTPVDIKNEIATTKSKLPIEIEAFFNFFESERSPLKEKIKYEAQELNFLKRTSRAKLVF